MKTRGKKIILVSAILFVMGIVITGIGVLLGGLPGFAVSGNGIYSTSHQEEPYELNKTKIEAFKSANIELDYADVDILASDDSNYYLEYTLNGSSGKPSYEVKNGAFKFTQKDHRITFINFGVFYNTRGEMTDPYIRLYVPKDAKLQALTLDGEGGKISLAGVQADTATLKVEYGDFDIQDSVFTDLSFDVESSDLKMKGVTAKAFTYTGSYGEMNLKKFSSDSAILDLESYDVKISAAKLGGFDYNNEYGDLELALPEKLDVYGFDIAVEYGDIDLPSDAPLGQYRNKDDDKNVYRTDGKQKIVIQSESGNVEIREGR